jgi:hypothetical protein
LVGTLFTWASSITVRHLKVYQKTLLN